MEIKQSSIQGVGLFSTRDLHASEKLFDYIGVEMSLSDFREKYGEYKKNSLNTYRMKRINRIIVAKEEPFLTSNLVNYINESLTPNCVLKKRALYALQDIPKGTELTLLYPKDYSRNYILF
jgi:SET domain-containing protein